jgi:hypothetical protein
VSDYSQEPGAAPEAEPEEQTTMSYRAVTMGLPVLTHSGEQFGIVEHVLEVESEDLFDGIVVYTGPPNMMNRRIGRFGMLNTGYMQGHIRFVDAEQVAAITPGYVKCTFPMDQVAMLPLPDGPPVVHPDMAREDYAQTYGGMMNRGYGSYYGRWFRRPRWIRDK